MKVDPSHNLYSEEQQIPFLLFDSIDKPSTLNTYVYAQNNILTIFDEKGLYAIYESCSGHISAIDGAMVDVAVAINSNCIKDGLLKRCLKDKWAKLKIKCDNKSYCGHAAPLFSDTIYISGSGFSISSCGPLKSTILHEMVHSCRHFTEAKPEACEKSCFGYGNGNPCECK